MGRCRYAAEDGPKLTFGCFATACFGRRGIPSRHNPITTIVEESSCDLHSIRIPYWDDTVLLLQKCN